MVELELKDINGLVIVKSWPNLKLFIEDTLNYPLEVITQTDKVLRVTWKGIPCATEEDNWSQSQVYNWAKILWLMEEKDL